MTEAEVLARFDFSGPDAVLVDCSRGQRCDGGAGLEWRVTYVAETRAPDLGVLVGPQDGPRPPDALLDRGRVTTAGESEV